MLVASLRLQSSWISWGPMKDHLWLIWVAHLLQHDSSSCLCLTVVAKNYSGHHIQQKPRRFWKWDLNEAQNSSRIHRHKRQVKWCRPVKVRQKLYPGIFWAPVGLITTARLIILCDLTPPQVLEFVLPFHAMTYHFICIALDLGWVRRECQLPCSGDRFDRLLQKREHDFSQISRHIKTPRQRVWCVVCGVDFYQLPILHGQCILCLAKFKNITRFFLPWHEMNTCRPCRWRRSGCQKCSSQLINVVLDWSPWASLGLSDVFLDFDWEMMIVDIDVLRATLWSCVSKRYCTLGSWAMQSGGRVTSASFSTIKHKYIKQLKQLIFSWCWLKDWLHMAALQMDEPKKLATNCLYGYAACSFDDWFWFAVNAICHAKNNALLL